MVAASTPVDEQVQIRRVLDFYERTLKPLYEPTRMGDYISLDTVSLDYEIDQSSIVARKRLKERRPEAEFVTLEVGQPVIQGLFPLCVVQDGSG